MIFRKYNHCNGNKCYHKKFLDAQHRTWIAVSVIVAVTFLILTLLRVIQHYWREEKGLRNFTVPLSPISMTAYAYMPEAGSSAQPKFDLADVPEREKNKALIRRIWGRDAGIALKIARCESGYRTEATNENINGTEDQGVFQVNTVHQMPDMLNATANISYAYTLYLSQGTAPWTSSEKCWKNL